MEIVEAFIQWKCYSENVVEELIHFLATFKRSSVKEDAENYGLVALKIFNLFLCIDCWTLYSIFLEL